jgi:hypothetical protein
MLGHLVSNNPRHFVPARPPRNWFKRLIEFLFGAAKTHS